MLAHLPDPSKDFSRPLKDIPTAFKELKFIKNTFKVLPERLFINQYKIALTLISASYKGKQFNTDILVEVN